MATESPLFLDGSNTTAAVYLSASQFLAVKITAARQVNLANTGGEAFIGILQNKPTLGQAALYGYLGVSKVVAGAAFAAGADLMTDTSARMITATSTNHRNAIALEAATAAGQIVAVFITGANRTA